MIAWGYSETISKIMEQIGSEGYTWEKTLLDGAKLFLQERKYLVNLLLHTSGHDSFVRYMSDINSEALTAHILQVTERDVLDEKLEMYIRIYCLGTVSLTCEWLLGKYEASPEDWTCPRCKQPKEKFNKA